MPCRSLPRDAPIAGGTKSAALKTAYDEAQTESHWCLPYEERTKRRS